MTWLAIVGQVLVEVGRFVTGALENAGASEASILHRLRVVLGSAVSSIDARLRELDAARAEEDRIIREGGPKE